MNDSSHWRERHTGGRVRIMSSDIGRIHRMQGRQSRAVPLPVGWWMVGLVILGIAWRLMA